VLNISLFAKGNIGLGCRFDKKKLDLALGYNQASTAVDVETRTNSPTQSNAVVADGCKHVYATVLYILQTKRNASRAARDVDARVGMSAACADTSILLVFFTCNCKPEVGGRCSSGRKHGGIS
jgi:hypothetical protein